MKTVTIVWNDGESVDFEFDVYSLGCDLTEDQDLEELKDDLKSALEDGGSIMLDSHIVPLIDVRYITVGLSDED